MEVRRRRSRSRAAAHLRRCDARSKCSPRFRLKSPEMNPNVLWQSPEGQRILINWKLQGCFKDSQFLTMELIIAMQKLYYSTSIPTKPMVMLIVYQRKMIN